MVCADCADFFQRTGAGLLSPRRIVDRNLNDRVCIDQLENPDTIHFTPAGIWTDRVLISGSIGTAYTSETTVSLMKRFSGAIRKLFLKVRAFYVGPAAQKLWEAGARLTSAVQSPPEYDLRPEGSQTTATRPET